MSSSSFASFRFIRGCRALLAPLQSPSTASSAKTTSSSSKSKPTGKKTAQKPHSRSSSSPSSPKPRRALTRPTGIQKVAPVSPVLHSFLGVSEASRGQAVKQVWAYVKQNNLQNPVDGREIKCDEKLKSLFEGKDKVGFLEVGKLLSRHFQKEH